MNTPVPWDLCALGSLYAFQNGVNADKRAYGRGVPFINVLEVINDPKISISKVAGRVTLHPRQVQAFEVRQGDVLFNRTSETLEEVGLASVYEGNGPVVFGGFVIRARPRNERLLPGYAAYALRAKGVRQQIVSRGQGAVRANVGQQQLATVNLPVPPLREQQAIADALSDADALLEALERLIAKKRLLKQGVMQELLTGRKRLAGQRAEWQIRQFGQVAKPRKERVDPKRLVLDTLCIELEDLEPNTGRANCSGVVRADSALKSVFQPGDVLFGKLRAYLRKYWLADRPGVCSTEIWVLVPNPAEITPHFLRQIVALDRFVQSADSSYGTHMPRSDWNVVSGLEFSIPAVEEQIAITKILTDMDAEIDALEAKLQKLSLIKQGMMHDLLTGRVRLV